MSLGLPKSRPARPRELSRSDAAEAPRIASGRVIFAVVATAIFMTNLDLWIVNVALSAIGADLPGSSLSGLSWVLNAYAVTLAALLVLAGRTGDRVGARRLFLIGIAVFTVASLGCAVAPNLGVLVLARIVQA